MAPFLSCIFRLFESTIILDLGKGFIYGEMNERKEKIIHCINRSYYDLHLFKRFLWISSQ